MLLNDIIKQVNKLAGNGSSFRLNYAQLKPYIESSVDYIGSYLRIPVATPMEDWESNIILYSIVYSDLYSGEFDANTNCMDNRYYYNTEFKKYMYYKNGIMCFIDLATGEYYYKDEDETTYFSVDIIEDIVIQKYDYNLLPDSVIRSALIYLVTSSYLEEEDELEAQYRTYISKAENFLKEYRTTHYSCIDCYW